jgi:acetyl-CoA acetyltransferase
MELERRGLKRAVAGVCTAGGMGTAVYLERP